MTLKEKNDIKLILYNNNITSYSISRIQNGISNKVYLINDSNGIKYILKYYVSSYNSFCFNKLINHCKENGIFISELLFSSDVNNQLIHVYKYIDGFHKKKINEKDISHILDIINKLHISIELSNNYTDSIFYKVENYINKLKKKKIYKLNKDIIFELISRYENLIIDKSVFKFCIVHGDLSLSNIMWYDNKIFLLDFDESIIATYEYEIISMIIKMSYKDNIFDIDLAKKIIKESVVNSNLHNFFVMWKFYILKVLIEKICLYEENIIDLYDATQKKDFWYNWYKLLNDSSILTELF